MNRYHFYWIVPFIIFSHFSLFSDDKITGEIAKKDQLLPQPYKPVAKQNGIEKNLRVILSADFLLLKACQSGLAIATSSKGKEEKLLSVKDPSYSPAFQITLGFQTDVDYSNITFSYSRYHRKIHNIFTGTLTPVLWYNQANLQAATAANIDSVWRIKSDVLDVDFSKNISLGKCFFLGVALGLRGGIFDQSLQLNSSFVAGNGSKKSSNYCRSWFIGPGVGGVFSWRFPYNFSLFADTKWQLLSTYFHTRHEEDAVFAPGIYRKISSRVDAISLHQKIALGVKWETFLSDEMHITFQLTTQFFQRTGQNRWSELLHYTAADSFSLQGFGVLLRFDF